MTISEHPRTTVPPNSAIPSANPPRAVSHPVIFQGWQSLTFLHWRYNSSSLERLLPPGLELDTFDGSAWIGLTPFRVVKLRTPGLPALPWISSFPETNVRTYVRGSDGEPGIWFFSLEAARLFAVLGARAIYGLPYRWAKMRVKATTETVEYESQRRWPGTTARSRILIEIGEPTGNHALERFLTARFRLYTLLSGKLAYADVEHEPWPLRKARAIDIEQTLLQGSGLPQAAGQPIVHYSPGVFVRIGRPVFQR
jgi:uncharacterized protein